jgi:hypothetical protein
MTPDDLISSMMKATVKQNGTAFGSPSVFVPNHHSVTQPQQTTRDDPNKSRFTLHFSPSAVVSGHSFRIF